MGHTLCLISVSLGISSKSSWFTADARGEKSYPAIAGDKYSVGKAAGQVLPPEQQAELDTLVEAELRAATARTAALMQNGSSL